MSLRTASGFLGRTPDFMNMMFAGYASTSSNPSRALLEIVRTLGAGGLMMTPADADVRGPLAQDIEQYYQSAALPAGRRIELFALANDAACSGFAGRSVLYERFFAGDPRRLGSIAATR